MNKDQVKFKEDRHGWKWKAKTIERKLLKMDGLEGKNGRPMRNVCPSLKTTDFLQGGQSNVFERWEQIICQNNQNFWMEVMFSSPHIKKIKVRLCNKIDFKLIKSRTILLERFLKLPIISNTVIFSVIYVSRYVSYSVTEWYSS